METPEEIEGENLSFIGKRGERGYDDLTTGISGDSDCKYRFL